MQNTCWRASPRTQSQQDVFRRLPGAPALAPRAAAAVWLGSAGRHITRDDAAAASQISAGRARAGRAARPAAREGRQGDAPGAAERERARDAVCRARRALPARRTAAPRGQGDHLHQRGQPARARREAAHLHAPGDCCCAPLCGRSGPCALSCAGGRGARKTRTRGDGNPSRKNSFGATVRWPAARRCWRSALPPS